MSHYIDTSVLAAYYCPEPLSDKADKRLRATQCPIISTLTEVEFCSAIARKKRMRDLSSQLASELLKVFRSHLDDHYYKVMPLDTHHYLLARDWISSMTTPLRTLDALHLAVCYSEQLILLTSDKVFAKSAKQLNVKVQLVS